MLSKLSVTLEFREEFCRPVSKTLMAFFWPLMLGPSPSSCPFMMAAPARVDVGILAADLHEAVPKLAEFVVESGVPPTLLLCCRV